VLVPGQTTGGKKGTINLLINELRIVSKPCISFDNKVISDMCQ